MLLRQAPPRKNLFLRIRPVKQTGLPALRNSDIEYVYSDSRRVRFGVGVYPVIEQTYLSSRSLLLNGPLPRPDEFQVGHDLKKPPQVTSVQGGDIRDIDKMFKSDNT